MGSEEVKVLSFFASPFGKRVEWALKLKGIEYEYIEQDIFNKSNLLLELNPVHKKVPVLVHAHKPIAESLVIVEYVDETWKQCPLLPQHPYQRALARFWADFAEKKVIDATWIAMCSSGEEQQKAVRVAREAIEKIEEEIKGKKYFGGESIGYLDIALGWISYWLPVWEEVGSMQIIDPFKFPATTAWMTNFLRHPVIKDNLPPRDKMLLYYHSRRNKLYSTFQGFIKEEQSLEQEGVDGANDLVLGSGLQRQSRMDNSGSRMNPESKALILDEIRVALTEPNSIIVRMYGSSDADKESVLETLTRRFERDRVFNVVVKASAMKIKKSVGCGRWSRSVEKRIQGELGEKLNLQLDEKASLKERATRLFDRIKTEDKILIILQHLQCEIDLIKIGIPFENHHNGCKILLVTHDQDQLSRFSKIETKIELSR